MAYLCQYVPTMYVERTRKKHGEKVYAQILLRESYRARKNKVDKRTLLNLTHFPRKQVEAIEWALRNPQAVALSCSTNITTSVRSSSSDV